MRPIPEQKPTIRTPTYMATRAGGGMSDFLGWVVFFLFVIVMVFLFIGIFVLYTKPIPSWIRTILIAGFAAFIFIVLVALFLVDVLCSLDSKLSEMLVMMARNETNTYSVYRILCEHNKILDNTKKTGNN